MGSPWDTPYIPGRPSSQQDQVVKQEPPWGGRPQQPAVEQGPVFPAIAPTPQATAPSLWADEEPSKAAVVPVHGGAAPLRLVPPIGTPGELAERKIAHAVATVDNPQQMRTGMAAFGFSQFIDGEEGRQISGFAITAFVAAFFVPIVAIVFGHLALKQTKHGLYSGRRMAIAGTVLGWFGLVWLIVLIATGVLGTFLVAAGGQITIG